MEKIKLFFKRLFCKHEYKMVEIFYGDRRNIAEGIGKCRECGKIKLITFEYAHSHNVKR